MTLHSEGATVTATSSRLDNLRTAATEPAIRVHALHKSYADTDAVRGIDLEVQARRDLRRPGPNGAGKTTTVEILEGYRSGHGNGVRAGRRCPRRRNSRRRNRSGSVLQESAPRPYLTVTEVTHAARRLLQPPARRRRDDRPRRSRRQEGGSRVTALSGGQKRRLDCRARPDRDPELIFLDEPTTGFDPSARRRPGRDQEPPPTR